MTNEELEKTVLEMKEQLDTILNTAKEAEDKWNHDRDLEAFTERNGETLGKYAGKLKKLNGDDFDIVSAAFDEYNSDFSDLEESVYVAQLVSEIDSKIAKLKEALGEDDIEIHSDDEGTTEVNVHDTEIETSSEENKESEEKEEEKEEESEEKEEEEVEDNEEEDFIKELEAEYDKYHK